MSNAFLTIGGREYTVACGDGEERHIASLGAQIDGKLAQMPGVAGQSEARTLLYAALLLADELHELKNARTAIQPEIVESMADWLESLAARLESELPSA
ncbi:cell division protein ZapA [Altererythrobacter xixiisoli]|uniref:Cell division protein ZapA n=1 Tax=Croceibacterium xixiisoli TaxID=1476466 RepID=A0A6I4TUP4_9SPHN|nr:cell division protein ZapA [Croceibacterium xixiisoli]MXO99796.1 cell division protein ZapA [Croceibacterium xixiisoli]